MPPEDILTILRNEYATAQKHHNEASKRYSNVLHDATDGASERLHLASAQYGKAQEEVVTASARLNNYLRFGIVPSNLDRVKKEAEEVENQEVQSQAMSSEPNQ
jgi:hypothetical protein